MRDWTKYIHGNVREGDCQLVSVCNAYYYLTGEMVGDEQYERLLANCGCVAGSCINIEKALTELGLVGDEAVPYLLEWEQLPIEISVWHKYFGFHSILVVDWEPVTESFRVTNFNHVANTAGWIYREDLYNYIVTNPSHKGKRWKSRTINVTEEVEPSGQ